MDSGDAKRSGSGARRRDGQWRLRAGTAVVCAFALVGAACGSSGRSAEPVDDGSGGGTDTSVATGDEMFGDMASPCGPAEGTNAEGTDPGVTADSITIGYGDDAGFPQSPGLNQEMSDAITTMIEWCNQQGGIHGRTIEGNYYDAKILDVNNAMTDACEGDNFFLVGQGWSLDASQEATRLGCGLPSVPTFTVSPQFAHGDLMYQPVPNPVDEMSIQAWFAFAGEYPEAVKKAAVMYGNFSATTDSTEKFQLATEQGGWEFLDCPQVYNIAGEADWKPFVQRLKDCGAEVVYYSGGPYPNFQNILEAASQLEYAPMWVTEANFYDTKFSAWNTSGLADEVYVKMVYFPFEQADIRPATQQYLDLVEANGGEVSLLGAQAAAAFLLWAGATQQCGAELTRDCVLQNLSQIHDFDAGGLQATNDPGGNHPGECGMLLKMSGTTYEQFLPETRGEMECSPEFLVKLTGPVVDRAELDADRISTAAG
jgi:ABC-type branched-subunit amino acid transport system substrate-binding protein